MFFGDSIVTQGFSANGFVRIIEQRWQSLFPVKCINRGVNGNRVWQMLDRFDSDITPLKPDLMVIVAGTNDVWYHSKGQGTSIDDFERDYRELIQRSKQASKDLLLITPHLIGEKTDGTNQYDAMLDGFVEVIRQLAVQYQVPCLDARSAFLEALTAAKATEPSGMFTDDGVHLNPQGQQLMAELLLPTLFKDC